MNIKTKVIAMAIMSTLKAIEKAEVIDKLADDIDDLIDRNFGRDSEKIQKSIVVHVLLPLAQRLMMEDMSGFNDVLYDFKTETP